LDQVGTLLADNRRKLDAVSFSTLSKSLAELRMLARQEVGAVAAQYHREAGEPMAEITSDRWFVAGHQPELFHPGVWFKNFALQQLAKKHGATALNLVVDTDTAKPALLHVPADGRLARVPFDRSGTETPYEERIVEEESTFAELPRRMAPIMERWNFEPMLPMFWREVMQQAERTPLMGERFAAARRAMERRWGLQPREAPMSRVCQTEAFAWFACSLLDQLPAFHATYNQTVQEYRHEHGIRSRSHPVPDLARDGDWLEAPLWAWQRGQSRRGRLFVQATPESWRLRVSGTEWPAVPRHHPVDAWRELESRGYKLRARALTTTLFSRLFLADVFIHGIGGGIYDELTDRLIERFFKIPAPGFLVLSATLLLPLPRFPDALQQVRSLERKARDLQFKPERFIHFSNGTESLVREKQTWIARVGATHAERVERFQRIRELNARMLPFVLPQTEQMQAEHQEQLKRVAQNEVATRRDYAFCLYPEAMLRKFFEEPRTE
jgi:hypothetical protein